jgi:hypothetical protein
MIPPLGHVEIWGLPLGLYFGILTFLCLVITATMGFLVLKGIYHIPFKWHKRMAIVTFAVAFIHITLVIWQFFF